MSNSCVLSRMRIEKLDLTYVREIRWKMMTMNEPIETLSLRSKRFFRIISKCRTLIAIRLLRCFSFRSPESFICNRIFLLFFHSLFLCENESIEKPQQHHMRSVSIDWPYPSVSLECMSVRELLKCFMSSLNVVHFRAHCAFHS